MEFAASHQKDKANLSFKQTFLISLNSLIRTCVSLTLICCYLMWAIVYLAQLHPLISEFYVLCSLSQDGNR